jgi:hypothetical protein
MIDKDDIAPDQEMDLVWARCAYGFYSAEILVYLLVLVNARFTSKMPYVERMAIWMVVTKGIYLVGTWAYVQLTFEN